MYTCFMVHFYNRKLINNQNANQTVVSNINNFIEAFFIQDVKREKILRGVFLLKS